MGDWLPVCLCQSLPPLGCSAPLDHLPDGIKIKRENEQIQDGEKIALDIGRTNRSCPHPFSPTATISVIGSFCQTCKCQHTYSFFHILYFSWKPFNVKRRGVFSLKLHYDFLGCGKTKQNKKSRFVKKNTQRTSADQILARFPACEVLSIWVNTCLRGIYWLQRECRSSSLSCTPVIICFTGPLAH